MMTLSAVQMIMMMLVFVWSGFVRAGLGFGGTALALPLALLVVGSAQMVIPIMLVQLFLFSLVHTVLHWRNIDWRHLSLLLAVLILPLWAGVFSLIELSDVTLMTVVYLFVLGFAIQYLIQVEVKRAGKVLNLILLILGGYVHGATTAGGPPIVAVFMRYVARDKVRDTLLCLWSISSAVNLGVLYRAQVDLHWRFQFWLLPATVVGHILGNRFHVRLLTMQTALFYRVLGGVLLIVTVIGLVKLWI